jgi:hypothetical protein
MGYQMLGLRVDAMRASEVSSKSPSLIKIDVNGTEHLVLSGAHSTLRTPTLCSVRVKANDEFFELGSGVVQHLFATGF